MFKTRRLSASSVTMALLAAGCSAGTSGNLAPEATAPAATPTPSATQSEQPLEEGKATWRRQMSKTPPQKGGCYEVTHPSMRWVEVPCATGRHSHPPQRPMPPRADVRGEGTLPSREPGLPAGAAGAQELDGAKDRAGLDATQGTSSESRRVVPMASSTLPSGTISWAEGSFPKVSGLTSESDNGTTANSFSLQINTQSNLKNSAITTLCNSTANPSSCTGWAQFVYWQGYAEIWYFLINAGKTCPSTSWRNDGTNCYVEAPNASAVPSQAISNLPNMTLTGEAQGANDTVIVTTGPGQMYAAVNTSTVDLATAWSYADFNVDGNDSYHVANFNAGTTLGVQLLTMSATGNTAAPRCGPYDSTTGESNNLNFVPSSCCTWGGANPGIQFTVSNAASPTAFACPAAPAGDPLPADANWTSGLSSDAVPLGVDGDGTALYSCRVAYKGTITPGKTRKDWGTCDISYGGQELWFTNYQTLVPTWTTEKYGEIPPNAQPFGYEANGSPLYVCRVITLMGGIGGTFTVQLGKTGAGIGGCDIPYGGVEKTYAASYEVLTNTATFPVQASPMSAGGSLPSNAIPAGTDTDGSTLYSCIAPYGGGMHPGKTRAGWGSCDISYGGGEYWVSSGWEVLVPKSVGAPLASWNRPFPAGNDSGQSLSVCTAAYGGGVQVGKYLPNSGCFFGYGGTEVLLTSGYSVLSN